MRLTVFSVLAVLVLAACGVKPNHVDPPQGEAHDRFPRVYPTPDRTAPAVLVPEAPGTRDDDIPAITTESEEDLHQ